MRDPAKYETLAANVVVHRADVFEPASLHGLFHGSDVVINAIGPRNGKELTEVYSHGAANVTAEMSAPAYGVW